MIVYRQVACPFAGPCDDDDDKLGCLFTLSEPTFLGLGELFTLCVDGGAGHGVVIIIVSAPDLPGGTGMHHRGAKGLVRTTHTSKVSLSSSTLVSYIIILFALITLRCQARIHHSSAIINVRCCRPRRHHRRHHQSPHSSHLDLHRL